MLKNHESNPGEHPQGGPVSRLLGDLYTEVSLDTLFVSDVMESTEQLGWQGTLHIHSDGPAPKEVAEFAQQVFEVIRWEGVGRWDTRLNRIWLGRWLGSWVGVSENVNSCGNTERQGTGDWGCASELLQGGASGQVEETPSATGKLASEGTAAGAPVALGWLSTQPFPQLLPCCCRCASLLLFAPPMPPRPSLCTRWPRALRFTLNPPCSPRLPSSPGLVAKPAPLSPGHLPYPAHPYREELFPDVPAGPAPILALGSAANKATPPIQAPSEPASSGHDAEL